MPTVTALKSAGGGRIAVHLDGDYVCAVTQALIARLRLYEGRVLTRDEAQSLRDEAAADDARQAAYRLLGHRQRSSREMADRLAARGIDGVVVAETVAALQAEGLLDDLAFAAAFVADKRRLHNWGSRRIEHELSRLGVPAHIVRQVLASQAADDEAEAESARADAALLRFGPARPPLEPHRRRAFTYLQRRGFSTSVSYAAVQRWAAGGEASADDQDED